MINSTSSRKLTDELEMKYDPFFLKQVSNTVTVSTKLNCKTGQTSHVALTLLRELDILHACKENRKNIETGKNGKKS